MIIQRTLTILALLAGSSSLALAQDGAAPPSTSPDAGQAAASAGDERSALPSLPLFELPAPASDTAREHVGLAHARRDSRRAAHTRQPASPQQAQRVRAAAGARKKVAQSHLAAARERQAAARARRDAAELHRAAAEERRAAAREQRTIAAERRLNAAEQRAAGAERRANAGK